MGKFIVILISVFVMLLVGAIGALPSLFWGLSTTNYFSVMAILIAAQIFIGGLWNYFVDRKNRIETAKVDAANALADAVQHVSLTCSYCGTANLVRILVGEKNKFNCEACHETNTVIVSCSSVRTTNPIMPKAELAEIFKNIDVKE